MNVVDRVDPKVRTMINDLIEDAGISQSYIADSIGVSRGRINQIVNRTNPSDLKFVSKQALVELHGKVFKYESK